MLDAKQIRAARALLDWTQETLAERSGVARATIKNVETGLTLPRLETAVALQKSLEDGGIEFLPSSGLRLRDRMIQILEGSESYQKLLDDVFVTARESQSDVIVAPANPSAALKALGFDYLNDALNKRREAGIKQRILIRRDDPQPMLSPDVYRILPDDYYSPYPLYIYGSKMALVSPSEPQKVIIINDERFAEAFRRLFNFIWDRTEMPSFKDLDKSSLNLSSKSKEN